jgi:hypothetical protein
MPGIFGELGYGVPARQLGSLPIVIARSIKGNSGQLERLPRFVGYTLASEVRLTGEPDGRQLPARDVIG